MKKMCSLLLAVMMLCAIMVVPAAAQEQVTLEFFCWGAAEKTTSAAFEAMIAGFEAKYPYIKVEFSTSNYDGVNTTLLNRVANMDAPDVAQVSDQWVAPYVAMEGVLAMDDVLSAETLADFYPAQKVGTTFDGKLYSAPWIMQPMELYYNKTLLAKAGIETVPTTWEEWTAAAYKIAALGTDEAGNKIYGRSLNSKLMAGAAYQSFPDVWANGGEIVDANGNVVFNCPGTVKAYTELQQMVIDGVAPEGLQIVDCRTLFGNGQIGFHIDAPSQASNWTSIDLGVAVIDSYSSNHHLVIGANTEHPAEAALLVDYLTGPEGMALYNTTTFVIPSRTTVEGIEAYQNLDPVRAQFVAGAKTARALPVGTESFVAAMEGIAGGLQRIVINKEDVATVIADIDAMLKTHY